MEQKNYTIKVNEAGLKVVLNALAALPYGEVQGLIGSLITQARVQDAKATEDTKPAVKDEN